MRYVLHTRADKTPTQSKQLLGGQKLLETIQDAELFSRQFDKRRDMTLSVKSFSKGQAINVQCRRGEQICVIEVEGIVV